MAIIPGLSKNLSWKKIEVADRPLIKPKHYKTDEVIVEAIYVGIKSRPSYADKSQDEILYRFELTSDQKIRVNDRGNSDVAQVLDCKKGDEVWIGHTSALGRCLKGLDPESRPLVGIVYKGKVRPQNGGKPYHSFDVMIAD